MTPPRPAFHAVAALLAVGAVGCTVQRQPPAAAAHAPAEIVVDGSDYAFRVPDTLVAGHATLRFRNVGKVPHEMAMAALKPGATMQRLMETMQKGGDLDSLLDGVVGILITPPGTTSVGALDVELLPGRTYAFACNFQDGKDKPPHATMGMVAGRVIAAR